jgi:hypothetical protein
MTDRRRDARLSGPPLRHISTMVRPGQWVVLIDLSASGALIAGRRPLRPGARVEVHLHREGQRSALWANVIRCSVAAMDAQRIVYHAALNFEARADWIREHQTQIGAALPSNGARDIQDAGEELPRGTRMLEVIGMKDSE